MSTTELLEKALKLRADEKFALVEGLLKSLDEPDAKLESIWILDAEQRLKLYREGRLEGVPMEEVFKD